jgi:predicted dehydrogenase
MKILIAGLGSIGQRHFRNLKSLGIQDFVLLRSGKSTLQNSELDFYPQVSSIEEGLKLKPDCVIIANPTRLHLEVAVPAVKAGCHIFLEKPVSHSLDGCDDLVDAVACTGVSAMVGFQFRFHPALRKIKEILSEREIGEVISAHAHWGEYLPDWHPWENYKAGYAARFDLGGGVGLTLCHPFDYLRWFLGEFQKAHFLGSNLNPLGIGVNQALVTSLEFESGTVGSVYLDYVQKPPMHRIELIGVKGSLIWDARSNVVRHEGVQSVAFDFSQGFDRNQLFVDEMKYFVDCARNRRPCEPSLVDGLAIQKLLQSAP